MRGIHLLKLSEQSESEVDLLESVSPDVTATQTHDAAAGEFRDMTGAKYKVFNHRAQWVMLMRKRNGTLTALGRRVIILVDDSGFTESGGW